MLGLLESLVGGVGSLLLPAIAIAVGLFIAFKVPRLRRIILRAVNLLPAVLLYVVGVLALPLWWLADLLVGRVLRLVPLDVLLSRALEWLGGRGAGGGSVRSGLLRGERRAVAEQLWPEPAHPDLYREVPRDVLRPPYDDGRLIGGLRLAWLADRHLTESVFRSAVRIALTTTLLAFVAFTVLFLLSALGSLWDAFSQLKGGGTLYAEQWPGQKPESLPTWWVLRAGVAVIGPTLLRTVGSLGTFLPGCALACAGLGLLTMLLLISTRQRETAAPYEWQSKDADVRWAYRSETRNLVRNTYRQQVLHATGYLKGKPCYQLGTSTGTLRARGDLSAPVPDQRLGLDEESLFQHVLVFGGTGEGKTTALLKPMVRQLLAQPGYGLYVCDAKGVLWNDVLALTRQVRPDAQIVTIGTGPEQCGVNLLAGLTPTQVAGTLRSVMAQLSGGGGGDSFWPDMAASVLRNVLSLARAYGATEAGLASTARNGMAPYSLWWAYQAILRQELITEAAQAVRDFFKAAPEKLKTLAEGSPERAAFLRLQHGITSKEVYDSMVYLESTWRDMAKETKSGIVANVTQLLDGFAGTRVLRERFACGSTQNTIAISEALKGKIVLNALSSIEDGLPARIVSVLLKTSLYREARRRESAYRLGTSPVKPQSQPCIVLMDEIQELVTADVASGLSDATFWNVARSTGVAGIFATQTVAALYQAIGKEAATNFMQQARSKVFFRTEDRETVEYACWCAGRYERNRVFDDGHRESIEYRGLIDGWDPLGAIDPEARITGGWRIFFTAARGLLNPERFLVGQATPARAYAAEGTYVPRATNSESTQVAAIQAMQAAAWRAEDLERDYRKSGNELTDALTPADLIHMGRWHAFAQLQRAGAVRQDIVAVQHDFD